MSEISDDEKIVQLPVRDPKDAEDEITVPITPCCGTCGFYDPQSGQCGALPPQVIPLAMVPAQGEGLSKLIRNTPVQPPTFFKVKLGMGRPHMKPDSMPCALYSPVIDNAQIQQLNSLLTKAALTPDELTEEEKATLAEMQAGYIAAKAEQGSSEDSTDK